MQFHKAHLFSTQVGDTNPAGGRLMREVTKGRISYTGQRKLLTADAGRIGRLDSGRDSPYGNFFKVILEGTSRLFPAAVLPRMEPVRFRDFEAGRS